MNKSKRLKELFFNNLLLLRFDVAAVEKKYRVACDKNMFTLPNQKMFEVVTHFLFSKLDGKYVLPWPLLDKDQHRQFQKLTLTYLSSIAQESNVKFPRMTASSFSTLNGDRFYEIYVAFSSHVVEQEILRNGNVELILQPKVSSQNYKNVTETLKIETILSIEKFKFLQKISLEHFEELLKCANNFSSLIKNLKSTLIANTKKLSERSTHLCALYSESSTSGEKSNLEESIRKSLLFLDKVKKQWVTLENFLMKERELWKYLCNEIEENSEKFVLESTYIKVPVIHAKDHNKLNAIKVSSIVSEENGKPSLLRYMKLFVTFLEHLMKSYSKGKMSYLHNHCKIEETCDLDKSLDEMKLLNEKIVNEVLSNVKESIEKLQENLLAQEFSEDLEDFIKECPSWNFSSKSFHERVKHVRSTEFHCFSDENTSFLLSKSSTETPCISNNLSCNTELCQASGYSDNFSAEYNPSSTNLKPIESLKENLISYKSLLCFKENTFEETLLQTTKVNSYTTDDHFNKNMLSDDFRDKYLKETNSNTAIPPLPDLSIDLDFDFSRPFKMRESWQLEDSLQAMTLPDDVMID